MNASGNILPAMHSLQMAQRARPLGDDFPVRRTAYFTQIPLILVFTSSIAWVVGSEITMVAASVVASIIALYTLVDWLFRGGATRFSTIVAISLLLGYGLGTLNTWLTLPRGGFSLSQFLGHDEGVLSRGMAAVLLAAAAAFFFGELYERPIFGLDFLLPIDGRMRLLVYLGTAVVIIGFATNQLSYMGQEVGTGGEVSFFGSFLTWFFTPLVATAVAVFFASPSGLPKIFVGICAAVLGVMMMALGRRILVYTAMEVIFALRLTGYKVRGTFFKKALLTGALGIFVLVGVLAFMLLRLAGLSSTATANAPLSERINTAIGWVQDGTALSRTTEATQSNVQSRTFVLGFFSDVLEGSLHHVPALGADAVGYIGVSIPRVIYPEKDQFFSEELLDDQLFGLSYRDSANSFLTNGATDFGILGVVLYPLIIVYITRAMIEFLSWRLPAMAVVIVVLSMIFLLLQTENSLLFWVGTLRNGILFSGLLYLFARLPGFRLSS